MISMGNCKDCNNHSELINERCLRCESIHRIQQTPPKILTELYNSYKKYWDQENYGTKSTISLGPKAF